MKLIHYGAKSLNRNKFKKVQNSSRNKPKYGTGLWVSPINSSFGWKDWCTLEDFRDCKESNSFILNLKKSARVLTIDSLEDSRKLFRYYVKATNKYTSYIDFEKLSKDYDAIFLTDKGQQETRFVWDEEKGVELYGWDCESLLIMNLDCVFTSKDSRKMLKKLRG